MGDFLILPSLWSWRAVSRILSSPCDGENHLSSQPYPESARFRGSGAGRSRIPYLALHPMGFSVPRRLRFARCALTAPFHHHRQFAPAAVYFLWHFPSELSFLPHVSQSYRLELRGIAPFGVRTFLSGSRQSDSPPFQDRFYYRMISLAWQVTRRCRRGSVR